MAEEGFIDPWGGHTIVGQYLDGTFNIISVGEQKDGWKVRQRRQTHPFSKDLLFLLYN